MSSSRPTKRSRTTLYVVLAASLVVICCVCPLIYGMATGAMESIGLLPTSTPTYTPTHTSTPSPTDTPAPTDTPQPTSTPEPTETPPPEVLKPIVAATEGNVNLRSGPSTDYETVGTLSPGEDLEVVGRNADSSWWQVSAPGGLAWVAASVVTASSIDDSIPVVEAPSPPVQPTLIDTPTMAPMPTDTPHIVPTSPPVECPYIGNKNTGKFHYYSCPSVDDMKEEHKDCLQSREEAIEKGYEPCGHCEP